MGEHGRVQLQQLTNASHVPMQPFGEYSRGLPDAMLNTSSLMSQ
jgi:hypothetical protein